MPGEGDLRAWLFLAWAPMQIRPPSEIQTGVLGTEDRDEQAPRQEATARTNATRMARSGSLAMSIEEAGMASCKD